MEKIMKFAEFINESINNSNTNIWDKYGDDLPQIFKHTIYRIPTNDELVDVNSFNLTADDIIQGFGYTIVGRGIKGTENQKMIHDSIKKLSSMFPDNIEYIKALKKSI